MPVRSTTNGSTEGLHHWLVPGELAGPSDRPTTVIPVLRTVAVVATSRNKLHVTATVLACGALLVGGCTSSHRAPSSPHAATMPFPTIPTLVPSADGVHGAGLRISSQRLYPWDKGPVHVTGRDAVVVSPTSFALQMSDNGNCRPVVRTAALQPGAVRISVDQGRCHQLNLTAFTIVVTLNAPLFAPGEHG